MADEKKSRQRLTMTAMFHAVADIARAIEPNVEGLPSLRQEVTLSAEGDTVYHCQLYRIDKQQDAAFILDGTSTEGIEEATAALLARLKEKFEEKKKELLRDFDSVLDRHHGALRGARSKIREKKA